MRRLPLCILLYRCRDAVVQLMTLNSQAEEHHAHLAKHECSTLLLQYISLVYANTSIRFLPYSAPLNPYAFHAELYIALAL